MKKNVWVGFWSKKFNLANMYKHLNSNLYPIFNKLFDVIISYICLTRRHLETECYKDVCKIWLLDFYQEAAWTLIR